MNVRAPFNFRKPVKHECNSLFNFQKPDKHECKSTIHFKKPANYLCKITIQLNTDKHIKHIYGFKILNHTCKKIMNVRTSFKNQTENYGHKNIDR